LNKTVRFPTQAAARIANTGLRALSAGSRFALIIALAKLLPPQDLALYGLFVATVGFSVLAVGGEYYTHAHRELLSVDRSRWSWVLQHQAVATAMLYALFVPAQLLIFTFGLLPWSLAGWFFAILVLEHFGQELDRLLVVMQRPLSASIVLFLRLGVWVWPLLWWFWQHPTSRTLESLFAAWAVGAGAALILGGWFVWARAEQWRLWPLDTAWLWRGFLVGGLFLASSISYKALTTVDRYVTDALAGSEVLAAYVLFFSLAMVQGHVIVPAIFAFLYPRAVRQYRSGEFAAYHRTMRELLISTAVLSSLVSAVIAGGAPYLLQLIDRSVYAEHLNLLWLLLAAGIVYMLAMVPHYALYARGADKDITVIHIVALGVFGLTCWLLAEPFPNEAAAIALIAASLWIGGAKSVRVVLLAGQGRDADLSAGVSS
jgi:O-antigen/teichoic acid export membrane protein